MNELKTIATNTRALLCLECGKCTSVCPVSVFNSGFSPRVMVTRAIRRATSDVITDKNIWSCLTCGMCELRCPANIAYLQLTQETRQVAQQLGEDAICSHGGAAQSLMRIMATSDRPQRRMDWIDKDLRIAETGEVVYFVGCLPHFDVLLNDIGVKTLEESRAAIRMLNHLGIVPAVMPQERCCGHDLLWSGDTENFKKLAFYNIEEIKKHKAKKVVFSCPEGYRTFKLDYPKFFPVDFEVIHISEVLAQALDQGILHFKEMRSRVTFQDPCRLGRHLGVYDAPRRVMAAIPGVELIEMPRSRQRAVCCGVSAWINCSFYSKQLQMMRLREAKNTGAEQLVLACPKCEIHFKCAMKEKNVPSDVKIPMVQFSVFVAPALEK
jgi:heterodisulfide reductase subunit D